MAHIRLSELNLAIRDVLSESFRESLWVVAEIARVNANYSGHTYLDLVEKKGAETLAQAKATIWRFNNRLLAEYADVTGQPLKPGIQVLLLVRVDYHPVYGISLNVQEIDPSYSLGEMARRRQEVIDRLQLEGLIDRNGQHALSEVPQRIAVVSSATAAGWEDFRSRLQNNLYGYAFHLTLLPSLLQGDGAEASILAALKTAERTLSEYDVVAIIRGGGGVVDLSCFDSYPLARAIATFPLPIITGIGHERDTSVADIVAFHRADTPTAAAEYLIERVARFDGVLETVTDRIANLAMSLQSRWLLDLTSTTAALMEVSQRRLKSASSEFDELLHDASLAVRTRVDSNMQTLTELATRVNIRAQDYVVDHDRVIATANSRLVSGTAIYFERISARLEGIQNTVRLRNPEDVLRRGFSITRINGKAVRSVLDIGVGSIIETALHDGSVTSRVEEKI